MSYGMGGEKLEQEASERQPPQGWATQGRFGNRGSATLYDGVGSVKRHLDCARRGARFFPFFPERIFSLSCISTKARFVNPAVETGSTNHLFGHRTSDHDSFFRRRDRSREQGAQSA